ncbi:Thioredoxin-related transmembrane protein 1 [Acanthosepion pharaonis]|uniref:Thioredoxin-related transmembrane protein 1 n=1 Tax=Acanthosepion pharaonis TaxID=158019 RepID=A0A812DXC7_ACAPH|nr:Thioredoxin-related transmembrane protein 1 [Sepia pharaonis]
MEVHVSTRALFVAVFLFSQTSVSLGRKSHTISLTDDNWRQLLEGEWMVEFMAPWCPACQSFKETWENYATWAEDLNINVAVVDVTNNPGLSGRFLVTSLPTIFHVKDGIFRQYQGPRITGDLISFIEDQRWNQVAAVNYWLTPDSLLMSALSLFFKAAMFIRSMYSTMTEVYGIPEWGCYVIFAVVTLLFGFLVGLILVCTVDLLLPASYFVPSQRPRPAPTPTDQIKEEMEKDDESDIIDDTNDIKGVETLRQRNPQAVASKISQNDKRCQEKLINKS